MAKVTKEELKKLLVHWKEAYGTFNEVPFDDGENAFFKQPNRKELKLIMSKGKGGPIAMTDAFVKNCHIGGSVSKAMFLDENNTEYISQLAASIDDLLSMKKAEIKKH